MNKRALVILAPGFEDMEAVTSINILRRAGIEVCVSGLNDLKITGSRGVNILADKKLSEEDATLDACILPGGSKGANNLASSELVKKIILKMNADNKIIAAICAAPAVVLAPLGVLKNKSATCYPGLEENFGKDIKFKDNAVVIDGNIITSKGPATTMLFALAIVEKLVDKIAAENLKKDLLLI
jgi:4-methyl-5(b-hydroxyethyl)-thiazole monophosphate biosynthesis